MINKEIKNIKAVIFDMDGLMFDTEKLWLDGVIKTNEVYGYNVPPELIIKCMGNRQDKIDIMLKEAMGEDFDTAEFRRLNKIFMKEQVETIGLGIKKGLIELLDFLKTQDVKLAVASSSAMNRIAERFKQANLSTDYFDYIIGGDKVTNPKPDPQIYLIACEELGVKPEEAIALEDSDNGIRSAYRAGVKPILIPDLKEPSEDVKKMAYRRYNNLDQVIELFEKKKDKKPPI